MAIIYSAVLIFLTIVTIRNTHKADKSDNMYYLYKFEAFMILFADAVALGIMALGYLSADLRI